MSSASFLTNFPITVLANYTDPNLYRPDGDSLLVEAVRKKGTETLAFLTQLDPNVHFEERFPLMSAVKIDTSEFIKSLLQREAIVNEYISKSNALLEAQQALRVQQEAQKAHLLILLVQLSDWDGLASLIAEKKCNLNVCDQNGQLPLVESAKVGDAMTMVVLLHFGADPFLKNKMGRSAASVLEQYLQERATSTATTPSVKKSELSQVSKEEWRKISKNWNQPPLFAAKKKANSEALMKAIEEANPKTIVLLLQGAAVEAPYYIEGMPSGQWLQPRLDPVERRLDEELERYRGALLFACAMAIKNRSKAQEYQPMLDAISCRVGGMLDARKGKFPLAEAIRSVDMERVCKELNGRLCLLEVQDKKGRTPIGIALQCKIALAGKPKGEVSAQIYDFLRTKVEKWTEEVRRVVIGRPPLYPKRLKPPVYLKSPIQSMASPKPIRQIRSAADYCQPPLALNYVAREDNSLVTIEL